STVLDFYFRDLPPFDLEQKKHEFPDALVIHDLRRMADTSGKIIHVVSADGDFGRALGSNKCFVVHKTLESLLRELYGRKVRSNEAALKLVSRSKKKLRTLLAKAFEKAEFLLSGRNDAAPHDIHVDHVELSKITQAGYRELEGHYRAEAEFFFSMLSVVNLESTTETGGIAPF